MTERERERAELAEGARLLGVFEALGETADAVADTLRDHQIKGARECPGDCPIARYLIGCDFADPRVQSFVVLIGPDGPHWALPDAVAEFVDRFDDGAYPDLVEGGLEGDDAGHAGQVDENEPTDCVEGDEL